MRFFDAWYPKVRHISWYTSTKNWHPYIHIPLHYYKAAGIPGHWSVRPRDIVFRLGSFLRTGILAYGVQLEVLAEPPLIEQL
jgi:hypothetical protein